MTTKRYIVFISILSALLVISCITIVSLVNGNNNLEPKQNEMSKNLPPEILGIEFVGLNNENVMKDGWATVPADGKLKIKFKLKGDCTAIDMFITPTGTETYLDQKMVAHIDGAFGQGEGEYIWQVPKDTSGHFNIIAYNLMKGTRSELYNVYYH